MKIKKEEIKVTMEAPGNIMRAQDGLGGFTVAFNEIPGGTDITPLLKGLPTDSCHCPHWGYIFTGSMRVIYDNGNEELLEEGDTFYLPPGHTAIVEKDTKILDFSPSKELSEVMENIGKRIAELS